MNNQSPINHEFFSAPLVDLVNTNVDTLSPEQLQAYLKRIREMRASKATMKAKTSQPKASSTKPTIDLNSLM